jgi:hypothetical protein
MSSNLDPDKQAHLKSMQDAFLALSTTKYVNGQIEHGGKMWEKSGMLENAKEEVIDLWHYLCTLEQQINELKGGVDKSLDKK